MDWLWLVMDWLWLLVVMFSKDFTLILSSWFGLGSSG
jgi:hypothetical protein